MTPKQARIVICCFLSHTIFYVLGCKQRETSGGAISPATSGVQSHLPEDSFVHLRKSFYIGNVSAESGSDSAYVDYISKLGSNGAIEDTCANKECNMTVQFNGSLPALNISPSFGVYIAAAGDLTGDNKNEIILFSRWVEGWWQSVSAWTLDHGKWRQIAQTKAFISEDEGYQRRIVNKKGRFYLVGDSWDNNKGGVVERSVLVPITR